MKLILPICRNQNNSRSAPSNRRLLAFILWVSVVLLGTYSLAQAQPSVPDYHVERMAASGDGTRLAVTGRSEQNAAGKTIYFVDLLDATTLQILSAFNIGEIQPLFLNLSPSGRWILYGSDYGGLQITDTLNGDVSIFAGPGGPVGVGALAWSRTDGRIATSEGAGVSLAQFYGDLPTAHLSDDGPFGLVTAIVWSSDGHKLATSTQASDPSDPLNGSRYTQIWLESQFADGPIITTPARRFLGGDFLAWSPSDAFIARLAESGISVSNVTTGQTSFLATPSGEKVYAVVWSPDGSKIAGGSANAIWVWDVLSKQIVDTLEADGVAYYMIWSPTLGLIHTGNGNGLYQNGHLVTAPLDAAPASTQTAS